MPQSWTDRYIPMRIKPKPAELVRVMVGRVEMLDRARELRAEEAISALASPDARVRERAFDALRAEGRYVEPIVRRALQTTADEQVRTLSKRLLLTDFVTELRTALTDAQTGEKVNTQPVYLRAQLASLLREVGLTDAAKQEGEAALQQLATLPQPTMHDHLSRHTFRALARAHEGAGHDAEALGWYGKFVDFGSRFQEPRTCAGCHTTMGPRDMTFFRDWYAGRKFGEYAVRTGEAPRLIAAHEEVLSAKPDSLASQLSLAYLYEATGKAEKAQELWARMR
jgi:tetratricopeptide (TPR) repeat protein